MEITQVKGFPVDEEKLKAYVSIVLDDCFLASDLKVIHGPNGLFISMPSKRKKNGEFKDIALPLNRETREIIERRILQEYQKARAQAPPPPAARASSLGYFGRLLAPRRRLDARRHVTSEADVPGDLSGSRQATISQS
jgi:stage V sporulation protein G